jgi:signal transduction histidine kinase
MRLTRADVLALLIVLGAAIAGVVVWSYGAVSLGMTLRETDGAELGYEPPLDGPIVVVHDVTPGGNADRAGFWPGMRIIDVSTTDGGDYERGEPIGEVLDSSIAIEAVSPYDYGFIQGGAELRTYDADHRPPSEAVATRRIETAVGGDVYQEGRHAWVELYAAVNRTFLELELSQSIWFVGLAIVVGAIVWRFLSHGLGGPFGRQHAVAIAAAAAVPGLILPTVLVGTPAGIGAGYLVPAGAALLVGLPLARHHPDPRWVQTGVAAALVAALLAVILVVRSITAPMLSQGDGISVLVLVLAIGAAPALVAASAPGRSLRERASLLSLGIVPAAAATLIGQQRVEPVWPIVLVAFLVGWYMLPIERAFALLGDGASRIRSNAPAGTPTPAAPVTVPQEPIVSAAIRDTATITLFGLVVLYGLFRQDSGTFVVTGVLLAGVVGFAIRGGFLGEHWADAAIPLGVAVGLPVSVAGFSFWLEDGTAGWVVVALALAGLSVADVLAARHSDPEWRWRLLIGSAALAGFTILLWAWWASGAYEPWAVALACAVPLVPGLPVAFAADHDEPRAISTRLETLVVTLTLGVSATVLTGLAWVPLVAWVIAIVVWRRYALAPLMGLARRTQLQRDLAVAAAETERARLAADLHDDALQQLTMLVRTLDESGQTDAANEAREVATKLRSVVGDLRLPILDDLGAGAALEWLVERVEPLAGGPVKLERSDETRPPANVELAVFRVAQEALTNAIKHGKPPIAVRYDVRADGRVTLAIDDAGTGIGDAAAEEAPRQGHFGLANMQQRAEQIGALLDVRRWPAGGTRVALEWRPQ